MSITALDVGILIRHYSPMTFEDFHVVQNRKQHTAYLQCFCCACAFYNIVPIEIRTKMADESTNVC